MADRTAMWSRAGMLIGIYTRISSDDDTRTKRLGVQRQEDTCREFAACKGWTVVEVYEDNDISASSAARVRRPEYDRMLSDLARGRIERILVLAQDRLLRRPEQLEALIALHEHLEVPAIECVSGGKIDVRTSTGRVHARLKTVVDKWYAEYLSEKIREKKRHDALQGLPVAGGLRPFGYQRSKMRIKPSEAALLREAARRVLSGEALTAVCRDWQVRQIPTAKGGRAWTPGVLRNMLTAPRIAGLRAHRGEVVAQGVWPPIISEATRLALLAHFDANRKRPGNRKRRLLTGLVVCGKCGNRMQAGRSHRTRVYRCEAGPGRGGCSGTSVRAGALEELIVGRALKHAAAHPDWPGLESADVRTELESRLEGDRRALDELALRRFVVRDLDDESYAIARGALVERIGTAEAVVRVRAADYTARENLAASWPTLGDGDKRGVLAQVIERVVIGPAPKSPSGVAGINPARVDVRYRVR